MSRAQTYDYYTVGHGRPQHFVCFTDIAEEFGVGKGLVAGRFRRSKDNTITINNVKIKRVPIVKKKLTIPNKSFYNTTRILV